MENLQFKITIDAPAEKVWMALWEDKNYREWTSAFSEGSWADTDWKKGSKVLFLDAKNDGMTSVIAENSPNEFMSIKHLGTVVKGVEHFDRLEDEMWRDAFENYRLKQSGNKTELTVDLESKSMDANMLDYFKGVWPTALDKLKQVAERK